MARIDDASLQPVGAFWRSGSREHFARLDAVGPYLDRRDRLEKIRRGEPVEVEMYQLPDWADRKARPPTGRIVVYPDD